MLKRKIDEKLINWKNEDNKKPLIVEGARQVGKTYAIREVGKNNYRNYIEINFIFEPFYNLLFQGDISSEKLLTKLKILFGEKINNGNTLLFLDEI